jgi:hypothetical protein
MKTKLPPPKTTELHNELYKTKEEQQIFLVFSNWKQEQKETSKQSKIFLDFLIANQR